MFSACTGKSDKGILAAALFGLFGMTLEGLSYFGIYRLTADRSPGYAHSYRAGIFGYLMFGSCGYHVPVCAFVFLTKYGLGEDILHKYIIFFILPALALFWIFFLVLEITQIKAFAKRLTLYPKWCLIFSLPVGMVIAMLTKAIGNFAFVNALSCAWIAFVNLLMFGGLLVMFKKINGFK